MQRKVWGGGVGIVYIGSDRRRGDRAADPGGLFVII